MTVAIILHSAEYTFFSASVYSLLASGIGTKANVITAVVSPNDTTEAQIGDNRSCFLGPGMVMGWSVDFTASSSTTKASNGGVSEPCKQDGDLGLGLTIATHFLCLMRSER